MTPLNITPTPCTCNTGFMGPVLCIAIVFGFFFGGAALLFNIILGGKYFEDCFHVSSPIKETIYAILICIVLLFSFNVWIKGFFFKQISFEELDNVELIEEIHSNSIKIDREHNLIQYYQKPFYYSIKYQDDRIGVKTVEDNTSYIEHYTGTYKTSPVTATFDYYILHIPKED